MQVGQTVEHRLWVDGDGRPCRGEVVEGKRRDGSPAAKIPGMVLVRWATLPPKCFMPKCHALAVEAVRAVDSDYELKLSDCEDLAEMYAAAEAHMRAGRSPSWLDAVERASRDMLDRWSTGLEQVGRQFQMEVE